MTAERLSEIKRWRGCAYPLSPEQACDAIEDLLAALDTARDALAAAEAREAALREALQHQLSAWATMGAEFSYSGDDDALSIIQSAYQDVTRLLAATEPQEGAGT